MTHIVRPGKLLQKPSWLRYLTLRAIRSLGYDVRRVESPRTLKTEPAGTSPVTLEYCPSRRGHAVFDIPVEECRAFHALGLPLRQDSHPFVRAFRMASREGAGHPSHVIEEVLRGYYDSVQPASALDLLDLSESDAPGLVGVPPIAYLLPWWETDIREMGERRERSLRYVGMRYGIRLETTGGHTFFGPSSAARLKLQVARLSQLLESVQRRGFRPFVRNSPTKVVALHRQGKFRWLLEEGQHRFALAGSLHVKSVPAAVTAVVRRADARHWPQVVSGVFSESGSLKLFDRIFAGAPSRCCEAWISQSLEPRAERSGQRSQLS